MGTLSSFSDFPGSQENRPKFGKTWREHPYEQEREEGLEGLGDRLEEVLKQKKKRSKSAGLEMSDYSILDFVKEAAGDVVYMYPQSYRRQEEKPSLAEKAIRAGVTGLGLYGGYQAFKGLAPNLYKDIKRTYEGGKRAYQHGLPTMKQFREAAKPAKKPSTSSSTATTTTKAPKPTEAASPKKKSPKAPPMAPIRKKTRGK